MTPLAADHILMALALTRGTLICTEEASETELKEAYDERRVFELMPGYGFVLILPGARKTEYLS